MNNRSLVSVGVGSKSHDVFDKIISVENLFSAWREFKRGKMKKTDVQSFAFNLEDNIFALHADLVSRCYVHGQYVCFYVTDPKLRHIHKASVRDRVLHQAVYRQLYPIFDKRFIYDSYSCRVDKGTHAAVNRLDLFCKKASYNNAENIFALKCDIRKYFHSIDHKILKKLISEVVSDSEVLWLINCIVESVPGGVGIPLGNVTSQLFANIFLNQLDQYVKHTIKYKYYLRYCDDFIFLDKDLYNLDLLIVKVRYFLDSNLSLELHPRKIIIRKYSQGIDFLGYVILPYHRALRTKTRRRMLKRLSCDVRPEVVASYLGYAKHANTYALLKTFVNRSFPALREPEIKGFQKKYICVKMDLL